MNVVRAVTLFLMGVSLVSGMGLGRAITLHELTNDGFQVTDGLMLVPCVRKEESSPYRCVPPLGLWIRGIDDPYNDDGQVLPPPAFELVPEYRQEPPRFEDVPDCKQGLSTPEELPCKMIFGAPTPTPEEAPIVPKRPGLTL